MVVSQESQIRNCQSPTAHGLAWTLPRFALSRLLDGGGGGKVGDKAGGRADSHPLFLFFYFFLFFCLIPYLNFGVFGPKEESFNTTSHLKTIVFV
jgi:hypothetical protein